MVATKSILKTKLKPRRLPLLATEARQEEVIKSWVEEDHKKLLLLCQELGINESPHQFYELALKLARKHHIGFQESAPLVKWTDIAGAYLVVEIERLTADCKPGHSELWACYQLIKRPDWREFLGMGEDPKKPNTKDSGEALRKQHQRFKKNPFTAVARDAFKLYELQNDVGEWESNLRDVLRNPHP